MNKSYVFGAVATVACGVIVFSGCTTEKIVADYVMPARQISDVKSIDLLAIEVKADVKGSVANGDMSGPVAGLVNQLTSAQLYKGGYITTVDGIWGNVAGAKAIQDFVANKKSQHGHASFATEQGLAKAILTLDLSLVADSKRVMKEKTFTLSTIPYKVNPPKKDGDAPTSVPGPPVVEKVKQPYWAYETVVTGLLKASLVDKAGKQLYSAEYKVAMPKKAALSSASPSLLKAVSLAVGPAVSEVVADISPYKMSREFEANREGNEKVVLLLEAKAFAAAIEAVEALKEKTFADWENQGLAYEASGDFNSAKGSYKEALKLKSDANGALEGIKRMDDMLAAKKAVKKSGAKKDAATSFKK